jgi:sodium/bile acid cotransporter 7
MRRFLAKRWFLLLLCGGVTLTFIRPEWVRPAVAWLPPRGVVAVALFLMAWGLDSRRLYIAAVRPWPALWAVAVSYVALPLFALLAGTLLPLDLALGLLIIASVPCTLASAQLWTRMAGGNEAVALLVVMLTIGASWLATTWWLTVAAPVRAEVRPGVMMADLFAVLIGPVGAGQLARLIPGMPETAIRHRTPLSAVAQLLVLSIILKATVDVPECVSNLTALAVPATILACAGTHLAALALGFWGGRALRFARADCVAVAFAGSQKSLPVALSLFQVFYHDSYPLAVVPLAFYHVGQLVMDTFIADKLMSGSHNRTEKSITAHGVEQR